MPKLSSLQIEQGREHDFSGALPKRPRATVRKSDLKPVTERPPCDLCHGSRHAPLEMLRYLPRQRVWACKTCQEQPA